ncbi:hypothetical protein [Erythrobacter colymbi]|uniref:hypothetical protein n=1 Tax=Erythrobacter colymbi TaxID=1161202 RepID=UPI00117C869F|nr:hypothetical protein [Erythrobacter colymbi]
MTRTPEQKMKESAEIKAAQMANESQRDAFTALGHTVLFSASIAFLADIRKPSEIEQIWLLYSAWASTLIGLFALTWSFQEAHRAANRRISSLHDDNASDATPLLDALNFVSLWSFPISMLGIAAFAAINLWSIT